MELPGFNGATPQQAWKVWNMPEVLCLTYASMGPRLNRRGKPAELRCLDSETRASMGPRLNRRGKFLTM